MASLNATRMLAESPVTSDEAVFPSLSDISINYTIAFVTSLLVITGTYCVYTRISGKAQPGGPDGLGPHAANGRGSKLRNIPWRGGMPFFSDEKYHRDTDVYISEGFKRLGDIFAFRFRTVSVVDCGVILEFFSHLWNDF